MGLDAASRQEKQLRAYCSQTMNLQEAADLLAQQNAICKGAIELLKVFHALAYLLLTEKNAVTQRSYQITLSPTV